MRNSQLERNWLRTCRFDAQTDVVLARITGLLRKGKADAGRSWHCHAAWTIPVNHQSFLAKHERPIADHSKTSRSVDAATIKLRTAGASLENYVVRAGF